jgi:hypothetical protein
MAFLPSFMKIDSDVQVVLLRLLPTIWEIVVLLLLIRGIYQVAELTSDGMIYVPTTIMIG